ncbi:hypothetical protein HMPREF0658_0923 [Hoylesella marshii DSM 16973 = JCM 13450]|jgi:hypothetical protein|uniref:Uncharacterized protein n=1 Tax=Hoylesella marshii DSM 16973 = JCM 13450 TaxID=862515 RepID=E0NRX2_9BACT|nr:hypothetical protein HMPREF0658_0923 [Hoylesella marshii DSM 16973 = JCM 13450]
MKEKGIFPFSATLDKSYQIILLFPQILLCTSQLPLFLFRSVFLSPFRAILHK